jgi:hypothetical protein
MRSIAGSERNYSTHSSQPSKSLMLKNSNEAVKTSVKEIKSKESLKPSVKEIKSKESLQSSVKDIKIDSSSLLSVPKFSRRDNNFSTTSEPIQLGDDIFDESFESLESNSSEVRRPSIFAAVYNVSSNGFLTIS